MNLHYRHSNNSWRGPHGRAWKDRSTRNSSVQGRWLAALAGVIAFVAPVGTSVASSAPASAQVPGGLDTTATATYTVDLPAGLVRGRIEFGFVNSIPPDGDDAELTFFEGYQFSLPRDATNVAATTESGPLAVTTAPAAGFLVVSVAFGTMLAYSDELDLVVTFDLPGHPPRDPRPWRANEAFVAFVAWGFGDPGLGAVRIVTPAAAAVAMPELDDGTYPMPEVVTYASETVHTFARLERPDEFGLFVTAADNQELVSSHLDVDGQRIVLQAWPDDPGWTRFMRRQVRVGLPALERVTQRPLPDGRRLIVRESANPSLEGYSGWFDYGAGVIEMGEALDPAVTLHELAHRWFNDDTSYHRWITEGLAETYANAVAARFGAAREPAIPRRRAPGSRPLNDWETFSFTRTDEAVEDYGYETSYFVVDALFDEIGPTRMAAVLAAIDDDTPAYERASLGTPGPVNWRRFLDLLEQVGGSDRASALFRRFVVSDVEVAELAARTGARVQYAELVQRAGAWTVPSPIDDDMEAWQFAEATDLMVVAATVLDERDDFLSAAAGVGVELPGAFEARFEAATEPTALEDLGDDIRELTDALVHVRATEAAAGAPRSTLELLGLGHEDFYVELSRARDAITAGDAFSAVDLSGQVRSALAVAETVGRQRALAAADEGRSQLADVALAALAGLVLAGVVTVVSRRRLRRHAASGDVAHVDPGGDATVDLDVEQRVGTRVELDEDALAGAGLGGVDRRLDVAVGHPGERTGATRVVERGTGLGDVGDAVLELGEDVGAVVDAQPVTGAEVLVDPDAHGGHER